MNIVLDPSILFATDDIWKNEEKRDNFIKTLLDLLDYIDNSEMKIFWNDNMELYLWCNKFLPWIQDKDFYKQSIVTISKKLHNNILILEDNYTPAKCNPNFIFEFNNIEILNEFLSIIHAIIHKEINIFLCVSNCNDKIFKFTCKCNNYELFPRIIKHSKDFVSLEEYIQQQWVYINCNKFVNMINYIHSNYILSENKFVYTISVSKSFIKDLKNEIRSPVQCQIIKQIIKKLTMNYRDSQEDATLQDEMVDKNEWRFRVSSRPTSRRIHYTFKNNHIELTHYYQEGEHDFGLRNTK